MFTKTCDMLRESNFKKVWVCLIIKKLYQEGKSIERDPNTLKFKI